MPSHDRRRVAVRALVAACIYFSVAPMGCEQQDDADMPRGGGYTEPAKDAGPKDPTQPGARSALGKARESAQRLVDEDIAEYNRKLEEAADGAFPK